MSLRRKSRASLPLLLGWFPLLIMDSAAVRGLVFTGERQLYLSSAGWAWLAGAAVPGVLRRWPAAGGPAVRAGVMSLAICWLGLAAHATWAGLPGWHDEAAMYGAMRHAQPRNAMGWIGSALGSIRAGRDEDAARALDHATLLDRDRPEIPLLRAGIELRRGRAAEALALAREALAREGWDRDAALLEVLALQRLERWKESSAFVARLHDLLPADAGVTAAWARQALVEGRPGDVVAELGRRSPAGGEAADSPQLLGEAYARLGEWTLARAAFERSVSLDPGRYEAWLGLAAASELAADSAGAHAALERARRLPESNDGRAGRMLERLVGKGR
jgi:tetratricopeptide (TPR) repeat protein